MADEFLRAHTTFARLPCATSPQLSHVVPEPQQLAELLEAESALQFRGRPRPAAGIAAQPSELQQSDAIDRFVVKTAEDVRPEADGRRQEKLDLLDVPSPYRNCWPAGSGSRQCRQDRRLAACLRQRAILRLQQNRSERRCKPVKGQGKAVRLTMCVSIQPANVELPMP